MADLPAAPSLTVVVAVYDVEPWLRECLDSVDRVLPHDVEVILVDDGSTDASGTICDEYAAGRPSWRVVHQANSGLGAARNVGLVQARGSHVGFVDGDDVLLPGYRRLWEVARTTTLGVATGRVERTDGRRVWASGLHTRALAGVGATARIAQQPSLVYDTTAWNKIYRTDLLHSHDLRFPEGVLYEDLAFTIPALVDSGEVGVVQEPVYSWRARTEGLSITQRRHELSNLVDRFAAVRQVDAFLEERQLHGLRTAHDAKVLRLDLPLYTAALPEADEEYRGAYLRFARHLVGSASSADLAALPPTLRLYAELVRAGRVDDLVRAVRGRRGAVAWAPDHRGALQRIREDRAAFALERELGLASRRDVLRRAVPRTVKLTLPVEARRRLGSVLARVRGR